MEKDLGWKPIPLFDRDHREDIASMQVKNRRITSTTFFVDIIFVDNVSVANLFVNIAFVNDVFVDIIFVENVNVDNAMLI